MLCAVLNKSWKQHPKNQLLYSHFPPEQDILGTVRKKNTTNYHYETLMLLFRKYNRNWPTWVGLQNTPTASLQRSKTPPMSILDMTLNNLMVRLQ